MRLFAAVVPPEGALDSLEAACAPLRPGHPELRWAGRELWHVTLAFLGEVDEDALTRLRPRLERAAARHRAFPLSLAGAGAFPRPARAHMLWTGVDGDRKGLAELAQSVGAGARRAGAPPPDEGRRYQPHVTLARARAQADLRSLVTALEGYAGPAWTVTEACLIQSTLGGGQPRYLEIGCWPLRTG